MQDDILKEINKAICKIIRKGFLLSYFRVDGSEALAKFYNGDTFIVLEINKETVKISVTTWTKTVKVEKEALKPPFADKLARMVIQHAK